MILGIDIGTRTTTVASAYEDVTIESRFLEKTEINAIGNTNELVKIDSKELFVNQGTYENNLYKYKKENFLQLLRYAVTKVPKHNSKVKVCFGIPVSQYNNITNRNEMKQIIEDNKVCTVGFTNNGSTEYKTVTIEEFIIRPEGYGIYANIRSNNKSLDLNAKTILMDIGGKTIDITFYDVDGKILEGISLTYGLTRYFEMIKNEFNLTVEDAEKYARGLYTPKDLDAGGYGHIEKRMFDIIYNDLVATFDNINRYNFILCGGGSQFFDKYFDYKGINVIKDNNIASNAITFYQLGRNKFGK